MEKRISLIRIAIIVMAFLSFIACNNGTVSEESKTEGTSGSLLVTSLKAELDTGQVRFFENLMSDLKDDPESIKLLGLYAYLNRNPSLAAWLFAIVSEKKKDDFINLANLGTTMNEIHLTATSPDPEWQEKSLDILRRAATQLPNNAAPQNNLGYALYRKYKETKDSTLLPEAESYLRKAIAIDPDNATTLSHLADVLAEQNKMDEAVSLLNTVHQSNPYNGTFMNSSAQLGNNYSSASNARSYCDSINFHCDKNCPRSIIGRIQFVSCEMAQSSALLACREGKPYYTSYNCDEEMGNLPFLIPGLNSGVCIPLPYIKLCIMLQGNGKIDYKLDFQVPLTKAIGFNIKAEGSYEPSSGQSTVKLSTDAELHLMNTGKVASELNNRGFGPLNIQMAVDGRETDSPVEIKAYDAVIWN